MRILESTEANPNLELIDEPQNPLDKALEKLENMKVKLLRQAASESSKTYSEPGKKRKIQTNKNSDLGSIMSKD